MSIFLSSKMDLPDYSNVLDIVWNFDWYPKTRQFQAAVRPQLWQRSCRAGFREMTATTNAHPRFRSGQRKPAWHSGHSCGARVLSVKSTDPAPWLLRSASAADMSDMQAATSVPSQSAAFVFEERGCQGVSWSWDRSISNRKTGSLTRLSILGLPC